MNMLDGYVTIKIDNPKRYLDVAALVDRPDFISNMLALRKKWEIKKTFPHSDRSLSQLPPFKKHEPIEKEFVKKYLELDQSIKFLEDMLTLKDNPDSDIGYKERLMADF